MSKILSSHNSFTYLPVKKWWMRLLNFAAKCQRLNIIEQYNIGVRAFDFRIRFDKNKNLIVAHNIIEYKITKEEIISIFEKLNILTQNEDIYIRIIHEVRNKKQKEKSDIKEFQKFCANIENKYSNLKFYCGRDLLKEYNEDYHFKNNPTVAEYYASVRPPKILDDWFPWIYAKINNKKLKRIQFNEDILMLDFVDIG